MDKHVCKSNVIQCCQIDDTVVKVTQNWRNCSLMKL